MRKFCLPFLLLVLLAPTSAQPEVEQAYKAIPHRYTPFSKSQVQMKAAQENYLEQNFALVNKAIVIKMRALKNRQTSSYITETNRILTQLRAQKPPKSLQGYHKLVISAITEQAEFFKEWLPSSKPFDRRAPKVQSSSKKLRQAYSILMSQFPNQAKTVKNAFFDHLCALDLI
jgi:hypothetical protein